MNTQEKVLQILTEELGSGIGLDSVVLNASGIDRNKEVDLVMRLEDEFEIDIPDEVAEKFHTAKDIVEYITETTKKSGTE